MQVGNIPEESAAGNPLIEKDNDASQGLSTKLVKISTMSTMMNGSIHMKSHDCKPRRKLKKKHRKHTLRSMRLITCLSWASLSLRKKKKQRGKQRSNIKNLTPEHLLEAASLYIGQGPSTSDKTPTISMHPTNPSEERVKQSTKKRDKRTSGKDVKTFNGECVMDIVDVKFRDRICQEGAMLATDKEPQKSSRFSVVKQRDEQSSNGLNDNKRNWMQNGPMSVLTRGLDDTIGKFSYGPWTVLIFPYDSQLQEYMLTYHKKLCFYLYT